MATKILDLLCTLIKDSDKINSSVFPLNLEEQGPVSPFSAQMPPENQMAYFIHS